MRLVIFSHKLCWRSPASPSGYVTDGGFPFQVGALSELFDETRLVVPCSPEVNRRGVADLNGRRFSVVPLTQLGGSGRRRKAGLPGWLFRNGPTLLREAWAADAVHVPVPGDVGTLGLFLAFVLRKRLLVRHCGNWFVQRTLAERFWKWFMEAFAGGRNVMMATGGAPEPPSRRNPEVRWIFSTTLSDQELRACATERTHPARGRARLIIVARQEREKGTGVVIRSLSRLRAAVGDVSLDVVGEGRALDEFRALAKAEGVEEFVTFHGKVDHQTVISLLRRADLFCFPTTSSEGFPKAVLEALACGLPVVTTRVSVLPSLIGGCGLLLDEATPEAVAQAVAEALSDGARYRGMAAQAEQTARRYSLEHWRETIAGLVRPAWGELRFNA